MANKEQTPLTKTAIAIRQSEREKGREREGERKKERVINKQISNSKLLKIGCTH